MMGRFLICALVWTIASGSLRAQENAGDQPGFMPLQYVPLRPGENDANPYTQQQSQLESPTEPPTSPPPPTPEDGPTPMTDSPQNIGFQPLTAATRPPDTDSGFVPVVGTYRDITQHDLVRSEDGALPRLYAPGMRAGPFDLRTNLTLEGTYNDNIYLAPHDEPRHSDYIVSVSPQVDLNYSNAETGELDGTQFDLFYAPMVLEFLRYNQNSGVDQYLDATLSHRFSKLRVSVEQSYSRTSGGVLEVGNLVTEDVYHTFVDIDYALTPKTSAELATFYTINSFADGEGGVDSDEWNVATFLNYEAMPKLTVSVAPTFDYITSQYTGNDQTAVGGATRVTYNYSDKTTFYFQIGGDQRTYAESALSNMELNYLGAVHWLVGSKTSLEMTVSRKTQSSNINVNQDYVASDVGISVREPLTEWMSAVFTTGYEHSDYYSTITGQGTTRYDYYSLSPGLVFHPAIWWDLGVNYLYRQNLSNVGANAFVNNQISLFTTVRF